MQIKCQVNANVLYVLMEVFAISDSWDFDLFRKEVYFEDIAFHHCVNKIDLVTSVMFGGRPNVPPKLSM